MTTTERRALLSGIDEIASMRQSGGAALSVLDLDEGRSPVEPAVDLGGPSHRFDAPQPGAITA